MYTFEWDCTKCAEVKRKELSSFLKRIFTSTIRGETNFPKYDVNSFTYDFGHMLYIYTGS